MYLLDMDQGCKLCFRAEVKYYLVPVSLQCYITACFANWQKITCITVSEPGWQCVHPDSEHISWSSLVIQPFAWLLMRHICPYSLSFLDYKPFSFYFWGCIPTVWLLCMCHHCWEQSASYLVCAYAATCLSLDWALLSGQRTQLQV